jgi:CDGSH-type Zn-finger protein
MEGSMAEKTTITLLENGPLLVKGNIKLTQADGQEVSVDSDTVALCRCGASSKKPFCDGTHKQVGFTSENPQPEK